MDLPILKVTSAPTVETLIRYYHQSASHFTGQLAESEALDFGTAWSNPQFTGDVGANRMMDVALPAGMTPAQAMEEATSHFAARGATCWQWIMNPSAPAEQTAPMVEYLLAQGCRRDVFDIMYLDRLAVRAVPALAESMKIIPARASFKHARALYENAFQQHGHAAQLTEAAMLRLDDPHYDALIAIIHATAVSNVGVLAVGEIGTIHQLYVVDSQRRRGMGSIMMARAMEICARSLFKHVFLGVAPDNAAAITLYTSFGFRKIGGWVEYQKI